MVSLAAYRLREAETFENPSESQFGHADMKTLQSNVNAETSKQQELEWSRQWAIAKGTWALKQGSVMPPLATCHWMYEAACMQACS